MPISRVLENKRLVELAEPAFFLIFFLVLYIIVVVVPIILFASSLGISSSFGDLVLYQLLCLLGMTALRMMLADDLAGFVVFAFQGVTVAVFCIVVVAQVDVLDNTDLSIFFFAVSADSLVVAAPFLVE